MTIPGLTTETFTVTQRYFDGIRIHDVDECSALRPSGETFGMFCPFDKPSGHPLADARLHLRTDRGGLMERICRHGVGHPDPDSVDWMERISGETHWGVHGCDGCCR